MRLGSVTLDNAISGYPGRTGLARKSIPICSKSSPCDLFIDMAKHGRTGNCRRVKGYSLVGSL